MKNSRKPKTSSAADIRPAAHVAKICRRLFRRRLVAVTMAGLVAIGVSSCAVHATGPKPGTPPPPCDMPVPWQPPNPCRPGETVGAGTGPLTSIPVYTEGPADGSGWSTQPMDQPRPMPGPDYDWLALENENCAWTTPELLSAIGSTGGMKTGPIFCVLTIGPGEQVQIEFDGPYRDRTSDVDIAFMRPIRVAGLEAREYDLGANQEAYPGSCTVQVNTRSTGGLNVMGGARKGNPQGTDPAPMCERTRKIAELLAKTFVPLAGGTPWSGTAQQPKPGVRNGADACVVSDRHTTAEALLANKGELGRDGDASVCVYTDGLRTITVWLSFDTADDWQAAVPRVDEQELTEPATLGTLDAYRQLAPSGNVCAESVRYVDNQVLHIAYENPDYDPATLCRVTELILGSIINTMTDKVK